jgi:hypothetical protein
VLFFVGASSARIEAFAASTDVRVMSFDTDESGGGNIAKSTQSAVDRANKFDLFQV